jgi:uncharacterized delta-60 repeat protein
LSDTNFAPVIVPGEAGALDAAFDGDGRLVRNLGASDFGSAISVQPDGKYIVVGSSIVSPSSSLVVMRYNRDGTLDSSWASGGTFTATLGGVFVQGNDVVIQPDGRVLVAGSLNTVVGGSSDIFAVRLNSDGTLDPTFGADGSVIVDLAPADAIGEDNGMAIALDSAGNVLVAGKSSEGSVSSFAVARFTSAGVLDASFASGGIARFLGRSGDVAFDVAVAPDGGIVLAGTIAPQATGTKFGLRKRLWICIKYPLGELNMTTKKAT